MDQDSFMADILPNFFTTKEHNSSFDLISFFVPEEETQYDNSIQSISDLYEASIQQAQTLIVSHQESQFEIVPPVKIRGSDKERKFNCSYANCKKEYRSKENLLFHIKNVHDKLKPFQCSYCLMKFSHRNGKIYHERKQHTSILPYSCTYEGCNQKFPCKSAMTAHFNSIHLLIKRKRSMKVSFVSVVEK